MDDSFAVVSHKADEGSIPFVDDLGESRGSGTHQHLPNAIVELLNTCVIIEPNLERNN